MWKPKATLNLQKNNFHLSVCIWFLVSSISEPGTGPVDMHWSADLQVWVQYPVTGHRIFLHFFSLGSTTHGSFLHFLSLGSDRHSKLSFFFPCRNKSERKVATGRQMHTSGELHQTALHISDKCSVVAVHCNRATKTTLQHLCQWMDEQKCYWQSGRQRLTVAASVFTEKH